MICKVRIIQFASAAIAACFMLAGARASAQGVKIGVLADQSGVYADFDGKVVGRSRENGDRGFRRQRARPEDRTDQR